MASSLDAKIKEICDRLVALKDEIDNDDQHTNLYTMEDIRDLIRRGEGLLESIRGPVGVATAAAADDSDTEEKGATTQAKDRNKNPLKKFDDGPNRKRKLGEDRTLSFLQALESEIVSGSQELEVVQRLVLIVLLDRTRGPTWPRRYLLRLFAVMLTCPLTSSALQHWVLMPKARCTRGRS